MTTLLRNLCRATRRFRAEDDGTASVEFVLWVPIFAVLFALMVDASTMFHGQTQVLRVVQDANRHMSIRRFTDNTEVQNYIATRLAAQNIYPRDITTQSNNAVVATSVTVHAGQFQYFGWFRVLKNMKLNVVHAHVRESIKKSELDSFNLAVSTN